MKERKVPMRKCVGCNTSKPKEKLIRIAFYEGIMTIDHTGRAKGRGVYICQNQSECIDNAIKRKSLQRSFPDASPEEIQKVMDELKGN